MISVVIPTFGKALLLERTLSALEAQDEEGPWEVIVVDDASADETPKLLRYWERRLPLRTLRQAENQGRARARNRGWHAASGDTVLFLDDDILLEKTALSTHAAAQRRQAGAWLGEVRSAPAIVDSPLFDYLDSRGVAKESPGGPVPARYFLTQNVSLPHSALEMVSGFDEHFGAYGFEDMELAFRLEEMAGLRFFALNGALGWHVHHHTEDEYFAKKVICGRQTLPLIAALHPGRLAEMQLDLVVSPLQELCWPRSCFASVLRASFRAGGGTWARLVQGRLGALGSRRLCHRLYDYRVLEAYARGLAEASPHPKTAAGAAPS